MLTLILLLSAIGITVYCRRYYQLSAAIQWGLYLLIVGLSFRAVGDYFDAPMIKLISTVSFPVAAVFFFGELMFKGGKPSNNTTDEETGTGEE